MRVFGAHRRDVDGQPCGATGGTFFAERLFLGDREIDLLPSDLQTMLDCGDATITARYV